MDERWSGSGFEVLREVWHRRKWVAILGFAGPFAALASLVLFLPDLYRSTAMVLVERPQVPETLVRPSVTVELETRLQTITQEILSRSRLEDLLTRFDLYQELRKRVPLEAVIDRLRREIQIEFTGVEQTIGRGATIAFTVSYRGRNPVTVAQVVNTLVSTSIAENLKIRKGQAAGTSEFLRVHLREMQKKLDEEERRVGGFKERHIGELPEQQETNRAILQRLNSELRLNSETRMRLMERLEREDLARQLAQAGSPGPVGNHVGPFGGSDAVAIRIARLNQELTELRTRFSEKYPDVNRVKAEIAALERQLAEKNPDENSAMNQTAQSKSSPARPKRFRSETEGELNALLEEEKTLRQSIAVYQQRVENAPLREQEFQELSRDYKTTKELYNTMLQRYKDAQIAESMEQRQKGEQFRILDSAIPAKLPTAPNRLGLLLIGLLLSLGLAAVSVVLAEQHDTSFHTLDELRAFTKVPVLVSIGRIVTEADASRSRWQFRLRTIASMLGLAVIVGVSHYIAHENTQLVWMLAGGRT